ncbi:MAG: hypothetical protein NDJ89_16120 [Oligoflexia bacterium]|nr:hypothetical protein [Oligoflexia bacterium]
MKNAVVLWTGGKDSCLALHLALEHRFRIQALATFVPPGNPEFKAHPQSQMKAQAKRLGYPLHFLEIREPFRESYIEALGWIKSSLAADTVITGDIDRVAGFPNWIEECCVDLGLSVHKPLWGLPRLTVLRELLARGIQAKITHLNHPALPDSWLGRVIDENLLNEMVALCADTGTDLAGENGEYHTMVI